MLSLVSYLSLPLRFLSAWLCCFSTALHICCTSHKTPLNTWRTFVIGDKQVLVGNSRQHFSTFLHVWLLIINILQSQQWESEISSRSNLNQNLHAAKRILHLVKCNLPEKHTHLASTDSAFYCSLLTKSSKCQLCVSSVWTLPPGVPWPHP